MTAASVGRHRYDITERDDERVNCTEARQRMPQALAGTVPQAEQAAFDAHTFGCDHCGVLLGALRQAQRSVPAAQFDDHMQQLMATYAPPAGGGRLWVVVALALGCVLAVVLGLRFLYWAIEIIREKNPHAPILTFKFSITYLMLLFLVMPAHPLHVMFILHWQLLGAPSGHVRQTGRRLT